MPTDDFINADQDQDHTNPDHEDGSVDVSSELAQLRKGNKTLSEQLRKQKEELEDIKRRFAPEQSVEEVEEDLDTRIAKKAEEVVSRKQWYAENKERIESLSEENRSIFEQESKSLDLEKALRLAEYNEPFKVTTKENLHSSRGSTVKREAAETLSRAEKEEALRYGISEKAFEIHKRVKEDRKSII